MTRRPFDTVVLVLLVGALLSWAYVLIVVVKR